MLAVAVLIAWAVAPALAVPLCFDRILLKDGRIIEGDLLPSDDASVTKLSISGIEVPVRNDLIAKTFAENLTNYKPKNAQEEEYLKKGFVLFEGNWMSASRRDGEIKKRADADKAAIEDLKKRSNWKNATVTTSAHFAIKSNCEADVVQEYLDRFEGFYKYFTSEWGAKVTPGNKSGKLTVDLYKSFGDVFKMGAVGNTFTFSFNFDDGVITLFHNADDPAAAMRNLYRSACSQLTYRSNPDFYYPAWIMAGMSAYFSTAQLGDDGKLRFGQPDYGNLLTLLDARERGQLPPLREALVPDEAEQKSAHYAIRSSFVHFLLESPKYGKAFRGFYSSLPNNPDAKIKQGNFAGRQGARVDYTEDADSIFALEKRLDVQLVQLEREWLAFIATLGEKLAPEAYYDAAERALWRAGSDGEEEADLTDDERMELVKTAFAHMARADELGIRSADFYKRYAELLRKGGIKEDKRTLKPLKPDPAGAWTMVEKAIALAPLDPYCYTEAAGILVMDGPKQDLDRAANFASAGLKIGGTRNASVKSLHDELMALIEPARESRRNKAEAEAEAAKQDNRKWHVAFYYIEGQEAPPNLADITTEELRELIRSGKVTGRDNLFQSWQAPDPETGKPVVGDNPWDKDWIKVREVPLFAEELAAANAPAPAAPSPDAAGEPVVAPDDPPADPPLPADGED